MLAKEPRIRGRELYLAILVDEKSRIVIQGITGFVGRQYAARMLESKTQLVAGVTPGKLGEHVEGIPVFGSVLEAVDQRHPDVSLVVVPGKYAADAVLEAIDAGIHKIIVYTEGVPIQKSLLMVNYAHAKEVTLVGPNSAGVISLGKCNVSDINATFIKPGRIGVVSCSGTLTYEVSDELSQSGLGVSTICCLGGDPVTGISFRDVLNLFEKDNDTEGIVMLGEIGGRRELDAASIISSMKKPVFAYIAGQSAPVSKRIGHAGAIISEKTETASYKLSALEVAGANTASDIEKLITSVTTYFSLRA